MQKVAVVTGAGKGLGREIALWLAKQGFSVVVHYNNSRKEAGDVAGKIKKLGHESLIVRANLRDETEVDAMFVQIYKKFPKVDLLVNNVGNFLYKTFKETTNSEFRDILESNIYSTLYCSREVLLRMRKAKSGHIINIGSSGNDRFVFRQKSVPYFLAKNGVYVLTKTMAWEEAPFGVHINMISPVSLVEDIFKKGDFPMGRSARPKDVLAALAFLISGEAYYINGVNLEVSGGFVAGMR